MYFSVELRRSHLKVLSSISSDLSAGLLLLLLTSKDWLVLTAYLVFAIVFAVISAKLTELADVL